MRCPYCKKEMEVVDDSLDGVKFKSYKCSCGQELMDMQQLEVLAKEFRKMKPVKFSRWGNSLAVRIPKEVADSLGLKDGSEGRILKEKNGMKIIC